MEEFEQDEDVEVERLDPADVETWWHGGPRIEGDYVRPRLVTGAESTWRNVHRLKLTVATSIDELPDQAVFITARREVAEMFASMMVKPWLYEVEPLGDMALDPLWAGRNLACDSVMVGSARILRRYNPSKQVVARWRGVLDHHARIERSEGSAPTSVVSGV